MREDICAWAADLLTRDDWALLELATTDLGGWVVEVSVLSRQGLSCCTAWSIRNPPSVKGLGLSTGSLTPM